MIRGTTPTHVFNVDTDLTGAEAIFITYKQGKTVVEKTIDDCVVTPETITVTLSQEETLMFQTGGVKAEVQIRAKFPDGTALAHEPPIPIDISPILKPGVI